jgi:hypothetical protein
MMTPLLRFKIVEIDSNISFIGKRKKNLTYPVRSLALVPKTKLPLKIKGFESLPEIFWQ